LLQSFGYRQELRRGMGGFSNFALSLSIICILSGGVTSFHLGLCGVGGASIGLGWPLVCLFALAIAATMAQVASAFPTAGGLYHWASLLGGRGWGWATAWFNLLGLITVLAAINVGTWNFARTWLAPESSGGSGALAQAIGVALITGSQALLNHVGIRLTARLTDLSGYLILAVSVALASAMLAYSASLEPARLLVFANYSGSRGGNVWPATASMAQLFALGLLLPAYTLTGFDASAHAAEETQGAAIHVPRGIVRSVAVSGLFGWAMLCAVVIALPDLNTAAAQGEHVFPWAMSAVLPERLSTILSGGIALAMYGAGLGAVTSASRMAYAFARDGGLPASGLLRQVDATTRTPTIAIWTVAAAAWLFTVWTPFYATITAVCSIFLYISYVLPTALGAIAYRRTWTAMGPWDLGRWYRPLAALAVAGCTALVMIGMQPPNERSIVIVGGTILVMAIAWFARDRKRFPGPPTHST
jgi:amino acid transporter